MNELLLLASGVPEIVDGMLGAGLLEGEEVVRKAEVEKQMADVLDKFEQYKTKIWQLIFLVALIGVGGGYELGKHFTNRRWQKGIEEELVPELQASFKDEFKDMMDACPTCSREISIAADPCPHCGTPDPFSGPSSGSGSGTTRHSKK